jgi:hypothetical protein
MKKLFTLSLGLLIAAAMFAADRRPDVTITSMKKYEIVVDGRSYQAGDRTMNLDDLRNGRHTIQVYEPGRGFSFFRRKNLVSSSAFQLRNLDVNITIDRFGNISIREDKYGRNDQRGWNDDHRGWGDQNTTNDQGGWNSHDSRDNHDNRRGH